MSVDPQLKGCRVLVVEDESIVSMLAEDILLDQGCEVILAMTLGSALEAVKSPDLDAAILDLNLGFGNTSEPVAQILVDRRIPFFFTTGYGAAPIAFGDRPVLPKPYVAKEIVEFLASVIRDARYGNFSGKDSES